MSRRAAGVVLAVLLAGLGAGTGAGTAQAGPYPPPSDVSGSVDPTRIQPGECATFSGTGFRPLVTITVTDNDQPSGSSQTDVQGRFSRRLCYGGDAKRGRHVLRGTGDAGTALQPEQETATAVLTVTGVSQSRPAPHRGGSGAAVAGRSGADPLSGGGEAAGPAGLQELPRTVGAVDAADSGRSGLTGLTLVVASTALVAVGATALLLAERRRRLRRRLARA